MTSALDSAVVDEAMLEDERLLATDRSVRLLHIEATVWAKARRTDGRIPRVALRRVTDLGDPDEAASALVTAGLWEETATGWQLTDYTERQMTRERVEARVRSHRESQRRYDEKRAGGRLPSGGSSDRSAEKSADGRPARPPARQQQRGGRQGKRNGAHADEPEASSWRSGRGERRQEPQKLSEKERERRLAANLALAEDADVPEHVRRAAVRGLAQDGWEKPAPRDQGAALPGVAPSPGASGASGSPEASPKPSRALRKSTDDGGPDRGKS